MAYGIIEYDEAGNPKCEICGKHFSRVITHVRQAHGMNEREYKIEFGFDLKKGICSSDSAALSRVTVMNNYTVCVSRNLNILGENTQFKPGSPGRTSDQVSEQTRLRLKNQLKEPYMRDAMQQNGYKLGKSGLGNIKRHGKNIM